MVIIQHSKTSTVSASPDMAVRADSHVDFRPAAWPRRFLPCLQALMNRGYGASRPYAIRATSMASKQTAIRSILTKHFAKARALSASVKDFTPNPQAYSKMKPKSLKKIRPPPRPNHPKITCGTCVASAKAAAWRQPS